MTIYVDGKIENSGDGSESAPFKTIPEAQAKIREIKESEGLPNGGITVLVKSGEYKLNSALTFTAEDSGTAECPITYVSEEELGAVLSGGLILSAKDFEPINDDEKARLLDETAREKVVKVDLKKYGLTENDWGKLYVYGGYTYVHLYDDGQGPAESEIFFNNERMTLSRWPNDYEVYTTAVLDPGECSEIALIDGLYDSYEGQRPNPDFDPNKRNPRGPTVAFDDETMTRASKWNDIEDAFIFGLGKFSWARSSYPVKSADFENNSITLEQSSPFGFSVKAPSYFYNVFEETDMPGEFYIDRENGILYIYPTYDMENARIEMSCEIENIITGTDIEYITFKGFDIKLTRANGIVFNGNNVTVDSCKVSNLRQVAINGNGSSITVQNNEIAYIGSTGVIVSGGDAGKLINSNNLIHNNYIHHFGIYDRAGGLSIGGCGGVASHNEICYGAHQAVGLCINSIFEYNEVYDLCRESGDSGAVYTVGYSYGVAGSIQRYNYFHDIGSKTTQFEQSHAIFHDGPTSGWTAYGNVFENMTGYGVMCGGGRNWTINNNLFINCEQGPVRNNASLRGIYKSNGQLIGEHLGHANRWEEPTSNELLCEAFPYLKDIIWDVNNYEVTDINDPNLVFNAIGELKNNIAIYPDSIYTSAFNTKDYIYKIEGDVYEICESMGLIGQNIIIDDRSIFEGYYNGDYTIKENSYIFELMPDFEPIPFDEMGRIK